MLDGSSPLARGLLLAGLAVFAAGGIIPARAGFTGATSTTASASPDHPRSRGVYAVDALADRIEPGSSPLARGLHVVAVSDRVATGIIPARAGFTPA